MSCGVENKIVCPVGKVVRRIKLINTEFCVLKKKQKTFFSQKN